MLVVITTLTSSNWVYGQSSANYTFSTNATGSLALDMNGNATDMSTGTTSLMAAGNDDAASSVANIGFNFQFMGKPYTQFSINSNGALGLGGTAIGTSGTGTGTATAPVIAAFGGDQATVTAAGANSKVHYKLFGTSPNRVLVVEWANMKLNYTNYGTASAGDGTYQVLIYETTGVFEFKYGAMSVATAFVTGPVVGFSAGTTAGTIASITTSSNTVATNGTAWVNNTYSTGAIANLNSSSNGSRRVYRFTPATSPSMTGSLTFTAVGSASMTLNWTDVTGEIGYNIYRSLDGVTYTLANANAANAVTYTASGLNPSTTYYWQVAPFTEGTIGSPLSASQITSAPITYYWVGATGGTWSTAANWNTAANGSGTTRSTASTTDILIVDGAGTTAGAATIINLDAAYTIGALKVTSNTTMTLQSSTTTTRALTISGSTNSFVIENGSTLNINNATQAASIGFAGTGNTGDISGTLTFGGSTSNTVTTTGGTSTVVTVSSTGVVNMGVAGITLVGTASTLIFANGSNCIVSGALTTAPPVPLATWGASSNLTILGITSSTTTATNNVQTFGNVTYNCSSASGTLNFWTTSTTAVIQGNLTIQATGTGKFRALSSGTLTINGNLNVTGGTFETFGGAGTLIVGGSVNISGGTFDIAAGAGTLKVAGNFTHTAGTVLQSTAGGLLEFNGTTAQTLAFVSGAHGANTVSIRINNAAGVSTTTANLIKNLTVSKGNFTGTGSLSYATTSILTYNSTTGNQTISSLEFPSTNAPGFLTINNTSTAPNNVVTLPFSASLSGSAGTLTLTAGLLDNTGYVLTIPNTAVAAISGGSSTTYVKGAIARILPASYSTASTYTFPVGKGSYNPFELVNPITNAGGTVTVQAEVVDANCGGAIGTTMSALNTNRYWAASITSGASNFTSALIKLNDTPGSADAIASSTTLTGTYDRIGGTTATITSSAITSTSPAVTALAGYFALGTKASATLSNLAITPTGNQCSNVARTVTITVTPGGSAVTSVSLNYSLNGVAQTAIAMSNTSGYDWSGTIPTVTPANANVTWSVIATDAAGVTKSQTGTGYTDAPLTGSVASASASPSTVCSGVSTTLTSSIVKPGSAAIGAGTSSNSSSSTLGAAFPSYYGNGHVQVLILASELTSAGIGAGNLTGMSVNVTTLGSPASLTNYTLKIGATSATAITTFQTPTFTTVYSSASYTPVVGTNTITFSTPFTWNGTSNIIVDYCFANSVTGSSSAINTYTTTSFGSFVNYAADGSTGAGACTSTTVTNASTNRPNFTLFGQKITTLSSYSWSDGTSVVGNASSITVIPTSNTTYTVTGTDANGCTLSASTAVTVNPLPSTPSVTNGSQCGQGIPFSSTVTSTSGLSSPIFKWYATASGGTALQSGSNNYYTTSISNTTTFYVSEYNGTCESSRSTIVATVVAPPILTVATNNAIVCNNAVAQLSVTSTLGDYDSYVWSPSTNLYQSDLTTPYTSGAVAYFKSTTAGAVSFTCNASNSSTQCINSAAVSVTVQPSSATAYAASTAALCTSGSTTILVTPATGYPTGTLQWQFSLNGSAYTDISGATSTSVSTGTITQTTYYQLLVKDAAGATCLNPVTSVVVNNPSVASTAPATRCGSGTVTLGATLGGNASTLNWYAASSGGSVLGTGSSFTTPSINTTTTYYVAAASGSSTINGGRLAPASTTNTTASTYGLVFDVTTAFTLNSVDVYNAGSAGTMSIQLQNSAGTVLQSLTTPSIPTGTGTTATTVNLGWSIPIGTGYKLLAITSPSLVREATLGGFPYAIGTVGSITGGYISGASTTYYYFYNWSVTTGCESGRTPVVATVNTPPAINVSASSNTICVGQTTTLSVTSSNTDYSYTWNGGAGSGSSVIVSPSSTTSYTVTASDNSTGVNAGCLITSSPITITVNPVPTSVTATASASVICPGGTVGLTGTASSGIPSLNYSQGFESWPPVSWTFINAGSGNQWASSTTARTGSGAMSYTYNSTYAANAWALTNGQSLTAGITYTVSFWYKVISATYPEKLKVTVGTAATVAGQTTTLWNNNGGSQLVNTTYAQGTATFTPSASGVYYFGFNCYSAANMDVIYVDDISITGSAPTPSFAWTATPSGFTAATANTTAAPTTATIYTLTATNSFGCSASATTSAVNISDVAASGSTIGASCYGTATGSITGVASGSYGPYQYSLNGSSWGTSPSFANKTAGSYTVYVKDSYGCTATSSVSVTEPTAVSFSSISSANPQCHNGINGSITFTATGGTGTLTYTLNGSLVSSPVTGLSSGSYSIVATDANGCSATSTVTLNNPALPVVVASVNGPACNGANATLNATSGFSSYSWTGPNSFVASTQSASTAIGGNYSVLVTDINGCTNTSSINVNIPAAITGSVSVSACINYLWAANNTTYTQSGIYTTVLIAANGCDSTVTLNLTITPQSAQPSVVNCWDNYMFNSTTCSWQNIGTQPAQPSLACFQTATFNTTSCSWDVIGSQPAQPTLACYQTATFNTTSCSWDVTGSQPAQPSLACYQTASFNTTTCQWDVTGTQPAQPSMACYETATFNTTSCSWDVTGSQPAQPTLACYQTATFNTTSCQWDVTGTQPAQPSLACYQTATFNGTTCEWDVTGTQPAQPSLACYQTASFNTTSCQWDVTGTQPAQPSLACYQTATFNGTTCEWDVTGT
ncbi:MAG: hypothetical protein ACKOX3_00195, partial [Bacteroidota bacterium]